MLYEYRSDNVNCLAKMKHMFEQVVEAYRATGIEVDVELLGERPCAKEDIDRTKVDELLDRAADSIKEVLGMEAVYRSGSTDCNIPLSLGIPAVCMSVCTGGGCHTRDEYLNLNSLEPGSLLFMHFLAKYF